MHRPRSFMWWRLPIVDGSLRSDLRTDLPAPPYLTDTAMGGAGPRRYPGQLLSVAPPNHTGAAVHRGRAPPTIPYRYSRR